MRGNKSGAAFTSASLRGGLLQEMEDFAARFADPVFGSQMQRDCTPSLGSKKKSERVASSSPSAASGKGRGGTGSAASTAKPPRPAQDPHFHRKEGGSAASKEDKDQRSRTETILKQVKDLLGFLPDLTYEDSLLVTMPWRATASDEYLLGVLSKSMLDRPRKFINVLDAYGGVGFDFFSLWSILSKLVCLESGLKARVYIAQPEEANGRVDRLESNVRRCTDKYKVPGNSVRILAMRIQDALRKEIKRDITFDLIYADPPWPASTPSEGGRGSASKPSRATVAYIDFLKRTLFDPLVAISAAPAAFICFKAPTHFVEFSVALFESSPYLRGYELDASMPMRNRAGNVVGYFHILRFVGV